MVAVVMLMAPHMPALNLNAQTCRLLCSRPKPACCHTHLTNPAGLCCASSGRAAAGAAAGSMTPARRSLRWPLWRRLHHR